MVGKAGQFESAGSFGDRSMWLSKTVDQETEGSIGKQHQPIKSYDHPSSTPHPLARPHFLQVSRFLKNNANKWGPNVQAHEPRRDISRSSHPEMLCTRTVRYELEDTIQSTTEALHFLFH